MFRYLQQVEDATGFPEHAAQDEELGAVLETQEQSKSTLDYFTIVMSNVLLFFLIFGLSATVDVKNLKRQLHNKFAIATGVGMQFLLMPALGFIAVVLLKDHGLTKAMGVTLLVVTSSPGGSYSNWWCSTFNADLALSVTMTSISSLLSVAMLPANLFLYTFLAYTAIHPNAQESGKCDSANVVNSIDFKTIFITLGIVMSAITSGIFCGYLWDFPAFHAYANRFGTICGILLVLFSIFLSSGTDGTESHFWNHPWSFYVAVSFPCLVGMAVANIISRSLRLSKPECVTISIECCYQNVGIATSVAVTMFDDPEQRSQAVSVPLLYGIVEAVAIGLYCLWAWKVGWTKAPPEENICVVLTKTYEIEDDDKEDQSPQPCQTAQVSESVESIQLERDMEGANPGDSGNLSTAQNDPDCVPNPIIMDSTLPQQQQDSENVFDNMANDLGGNNMLTEEPASNSTQSVWSRISRRLFHSQPSTEADRCGNARNHNCEPRATDWTRNSQLQCCKQCEDYHGGGCCGDFEQGTFPHNRRRLVSEDNTTATAMTAASASSTLSTTGVASVQVLGFGTITVDSMVKVISPTANKIGDASGKAEAETGCQTRTPSSYIWHHSISSSESPTLHCIHEGDDASNNQTDNL